MATGSELKNWPLVVGATLGVAVSAIPVVILSLGVFIKPLGAEFGWGRGQVSLFLTILSLAMAVALPVAGRLIDRFGVRPILVVSLLLYAAALMAVPTFIQQWGLEGFYLVGLIIGVVSAGSSAVAYIKVLSAWFNTNRGVALGFAMSGVALGGAVTPMIASQMIQAQGWAAGFYALGLLPLIIGLPIALLVMREPLVAAPRAGETLSSGHLGMTMGEALRSGIFWTLLLMFLIAATAIHGIQIHLSPMLSDRGLSVEASVRAVSFMFVVSVVARIAVGFMLDKIFAPYIGALCFALACVGAALLAPDSTTFTYYVAAALLGVGAGGETDLLGFLVGRYFGLKSFGAIYGWIFGAFMAGSALGPLVLGTVYDWTGSYQSALIACAVGLGITAVMMVRLPRFPVLTPAPDQAPAQAAAA